MINNDTMIPYDDIDYELQPLIKLINNEPGIETVECCSGHEERPCMIWCNAENAEIFQKFMHKYFYCNTFWEAVFDMNDTQIDENDWSTVHFLLRSTNKVCDSAIPVLIAEITERFFLIQNGYSIRKKYIQGEL